MGGYIDSDMNFIPAWDGLWEPHPGMLDFEEKWNAFHDPNGRLMVCAHRGDNNIYYPENSLEGCLSAIAAGADMLEVDVHTTKDGYLILMHDDTVTRTTNAAALRRAGETNLPDSDEITHWTMAQIQRLRLVMPDGTLTQYGVPTLRSVIRASVNRVFLTLDKWWCFRWEDVYAIIREENAFRTVLIPYGYDLNLVLDIWEKAYRDTGIRMPFFASVVIGNGVWSIEKLFSVSEFLQKNEMAPVLRGGYHNLEDIPRLEPVITQLQKTHRIYAESLGSHRDNPVYWQSMLDMGYSIFMGNRLYDLLKLVRERHFAAVQEEM